MSLNRIILSLAFFILLTSCHKDKNEKLILEQNSIIDSIQLNYRLSKKKTTKKTNRLNSINKAFILASQIENDTLILKTISYKTTIHSLNKQYDSAIIYSRKMLQLAKESFDLQTIGKSYFKLGLYNTKIKRKDSAYHFYKLSKESYLQINDTLEAGKISVNMAIIQSDFGDYLGSDELALEALNYFVSPDHDNYMASAYNCLAISSRKRFDYENALTYFNLAIDKSNSLKNKIVYRNNVANIYKDLKEYDKSIEILSSIVSDTLLNSDLKGKARVLDNLAITKWEKEPDINIAEDLKNALAIRQQENDFFGQIASNIHLAKYFKNLDSQNARYHAEKAYEISKKYNNTNGRMDALSILISLKSNPSGNFDELKRLKDSIEINKIKSGKAFLKEVYESNKKDKEIVQLNLINAKNESKVQKEKRIKNVLSILAIFLLTSSLLAYFLIKSRHAKEKLQQVYSTETRLSKKVHDELANDMSDVMNFVENDIETSAHKKVVLLNSLEDIYIRTRDISTETGNIDLINFSKSLNYLLMQHNREGTKVVTNDISTINWGKVPNHKKMIIYRSLQELMVNMKKHSKATLVSLVFKEIQHKKEIRYVDDGIGFAIEEANVSGLQNVESRIKSIGGNFNFISSKGNGFKAILKFNS